MNKNESFGLQTLTGWPQIKEIENQVVVVRRNLAQRTFNQEDFGRKSKAEINMKTDQLVSQMQRKKLGGRIKSFQNNTLKSDQATLSILPGIKTDRDPPVAYRRQSRSVFVRSVYSNNNERECHSVNELKKLREFLQSETLNMKYDSHKQYSVEMQAIDCQKAEESKPMSFFVKQSENVFRLTDISNQCKKKATKTSLPKFALQDKSLGFLKKEPDSLNVVRMVSNKRIKLSDLLQQQKTKLKLATKPCLTREGQFIQDEIYLLQEIRSRRKCISTMEQSSRYKHLF